METTSVLLAAIATWATIGLILFSIDLLKMARAWMVLTNKGTPRHNATILATICIEAAAAGPLYAILRTDFFRRAK